MIQMINKHRRHYCIQEIISKKVTTMHQWNLRTHRLHTNTRLRKTLTSSPETYTTRDALPSSCPSAIIEAIFQFKRIIWCGKQNKKGNSHLEDKKCNRDIIKFWIRCKGKAPYAQIAASKFLITCNTSVLLPTPGSPPIKTNEPSNTRRRGTFKRWTIHFKTLGTESKCKNHLLKALKKKQLK